MNRRFCKSLSLWIVPLLVLRALIPVGFMLAADANGLSLVFCSAIAPQTSTAAGHEAHAAHHADHETADHAGQHSGDHASSQHHAPCPFSLAAVAAGGEVPHLTSIAVLPADERFELPATPTFSVGPSRADRIRGPPSLA